ncbi:hypothetical protein ZIOFF_019519 [Zingiber officinale]|uniref:AP complex mu/sigma subunit domain-containing protein n=1 Tax=Zingiber officinale TaxID=94328 RepID=A0A8J5H9Q8_ZINOF|nr:hypothetical protein ZIOFF_019519 [Zingiber officinale]
MFSDRVETVGWEQIRFILLQNRQGKTRLAKYYVPLEDSEKHKVEYEVCFFVIAVSSSSNFFLERNFDIWLAPRFIGWWSIGIPNSPISLRFGIVAWIICDFFLASLFVHDIGVTYACFFVQFRTHKVIYRRYAGLFFSLCVDITDNELAYLECIHLFVEILDHFFSNVCELDLVFNFHKAIIERMGELEKQE